MELHRESKKYMENIFAQYTEIERCPDIFQGKTIIHLYPVEDTMDSNGDLDGFVDSLFFEAKFYMTNTKTIYTTKHKDEIQIEMPVSIRIFKDKSTMIIVRQKFILVPTQSMVIAPNGVRWNDGVGRGEGDYWAGWDGEGDC